MYDNSSKSKQESLCNKLKTKKFWFWLLPLIFAFGLIITVIIMVAKSVGYFQLLFTSINNELLARSYLKLYYTLDMAVLYLSIIGFMVVLINSAIYVGKFLTDKTNLTYFHVVFYLTYIIIGIVMIVKKQNYKQYMQKMSQQNPASANCVLMMFQCIVSKSFLAYQGQLLYFFIAFSVLFLLFTIFYHINAKQEVQQMVKPQRKEINNQSNIFQSEANNLEIISENFN